MSTEMYGMPNNIDVNYNVMDPNDERIRPGFGHFGGFHGGFGRPGFGFGFGRPGFGFGFGRPGFGFGFGVPFLTGLAAGALLTPGWGYGYPYYPPYPYYPWYY